LIDYSSPGMNASNQYTLLSYPPAYLCQGVPAYVELTLTASKNISKVSLFNVIEANRQWKDCTIRIGTAATVATATPTAFQMPNTFNNPMSAFDVAISPPQAGTNVRISAANIWGSDTNSGLGRVQVYASLTGTSHYAVNSYLGTTPRIKTYSNTICFLEYNDVLATPLTYSAYVAPRHNGLLAAVFCDGHADVFKTSDLDPSSPSNLASYWEDN